MNPILSRQKTLWLGLQVIAGLLFIFFCIEALGIDLWGKPSEPPKERKVDLGEQKTQMQDLWMAKVDSEKKALEERMQDLEKQVLRAQEMQSEQFLENKKLLEEIRLLQKEQEHKAQIAPAEESQAVAVFEEAAQKELPKFKMLAMPLSQQNIDSSIAAGTTVRAILLSSTDAICGVYSSSDPQPVKLRILDDARLPKALKAKLKGGIIIASAYGNLSSERVYMRLERLTKFSSNGDFIETEVAGYVSGEDGKYGVRGVVADKSEQFVGNAAVSGFFSGMSGYFHGRRGSQNLHSDPMYLELLKEGSSKGSGDAFEKLSEYYIKRAEQLQPVIQVAAGRVVDITFTHGVSFGERDFREKIHNLREQKRKDLP